MCTCDPMLGDANKSVQCGLNVNMLYEKPATQKRSAVRFDRKARTTAFGH